MVSILCGKLGVYGGKGIIAVNICWYADDTLI